MKSADTTSEINPPTTPGVGDYMNEVSVVQEEQLDGTGGKTTKSPRVAMIHEDGRSHGPEAPSSVEDSQAIELLTEIRDLLIKLVRSSGGLA